MVARLYLCCNFSSFLFSGWESFFFCFASLDCVHIVTVFTALLYEAASESLCISCLMILMLRLSVLDITCSFVSYLPS